MAIWRHRADAILDAQALSKRVGVRKLLLERTLLAVALDLVMTDVQTADADTVRAELRTVAGVMDFWKQPWPSIPVRLADPIVVSYLAAETKRKLLETVIGAHARLPVADIKKMVSDAYLEQLELERRSAANVAPSASGR